MSEKPSSELSLVGTGTVFEGKLRSEGSVRIDGKLVGDIVAKGNAAVGPTGVVEGNLSAKNISVAGRVQGNIVASEKLVLEGKSSVKGDIRTVKLVIDEGAIFDGHCAMSTPTPAGRGGS